jgi:hypothetical protein
MYVKANAYLCGLGNYDGQMFYESTDATSSFPWFRPVVTLCGQQYQIGQTVVDNWAVVQAAYGNTCIPNADWNFPNMQVLGYTFGSGSRSVNVTVQGWEDSCHTAGFQGNPCYAQAIAPYP